ncbi:PQQ-dependent sugar dehydrogenase [Kordiimonas sp.]|uniref:PQQ-dependent sugar dehydrogenase n=1 Tax=Kordiimonas sp. TaxID=1970157 RepID=UPI003A93E431
MLKKLLSGFAAIIIIAGLGLWIWWPENLVAKGPFLDFLTGKQVEAPKPDDLKNRFKLPNGFTIGIFARDVPHARMMRVTDAGDIVVTSMREGNVILLHKDEDGDGVSDGRTTLFSDMNVPHGLALSNGYIYVAETDRISRAPYNATERKAGPLEVIFRGLPPGGNHRTRTIDFGPDGKLYVSTGSSCNVCIEDHPYRATMVRMEADGSGANVFATGLRNTVGFDWHPITGKLYGTDNGRDLLGDDTPNCELNLIEDGADYGWPYAYDDKVSDPDFGNDNQDRVEASRAPVHGFGAHRAPLGMRFLSGTKSPRGFENAALVALHGSWNSSKLVGYKVVTLHFGSDGSVTEQDFLTGFEQNEDVIGRPVDIAQGPDGAIYISDDYTGVIYRVGWGEIAVGTSAQAAETPSSAPFSDVSADARAALIEDGRSLFRENGCAACHMQADAPEGVQVKELKNLKARYDAAGIVQLINTPPGPMPTYDHLSPSDREALAAYLLLSLD